MHHPTAGLFTQSARVAALLVASSLSGALASCAAGTDLGSGGGDTHEASSSSSTTTGASSSGATTTGGGAGEGGIGGGGAAGVGGGGGGQGGGGGGGGQGGGGSPPAGPLVLLAGGGATVLAGEFTELSGWVTTTLTGATSDAPGVAKSSGSSAVGVLRSTANGGELLFTTWSPGSWSALTPVGSGITTRARPSISAADSVMLAFQGDDFKHYYAQYDGVWAPSAEPIGGAVDQSFGPTPPSIAADGADAQVAFAGSNGDLFDQARAAVWLAAHPHTLGSVASLSPTIVKLTNSDDFLIAFVRSTDAKIVYTRGHGSTWSAPVVVDANALSNLPVALAALPDTQALLAYRGQDGNVYWSRYLGANWSVPLPLATPNVATSSTPAVATGIGSADAEMVFIDAATGGAMHARLQGASFAAPAPIGGAGLVHAAVSSAP
jgi:hypothetical protein